MEPRRAGEENNFEQQFWALKLVITMEAVFFELFSHLPAKETLKFGILSKQFKEFLLDSLFVKKQCKNMEDKDVSFFIQSKFSAWRTPIDLQLHFLSNDHKVSFGIPNNSLELLSRTGPIIGSSNGLLCCRYVSQKLLRYPNIEKDEYPLLLCNPVTRRWLPIVKPTNNFSYWNHCLDIVLVCDVDTDNDFMLMAVLTQDWDNSVLYKIYSPRQRIWEETPDMMVGRRSMQCESPVYLSNSGGRTLYLISSRVGFIKKRTTFYWPYVVAYNFKKAGSKFIKIPKAARTGVFHDRTILSIFKFKDPRTCVASVCLIKLTKLVFSVWLLTDADSSRWKLIQKSRAKAMGLNVDPKLIITGFTVMNGNLLVIATQDDVYRYSLSNDVVRNRSNVRKAEKIGRNQCGLSSVSLFAYSNTLRSCGKGELPLPDLA